MSIISEREAYLDRTLYNIERLKLKNKKSLYLINSKISSSTAKYIKDYFDASPEYRIEIKFCVSCKNTYDIIIYFM